MFEFSVTVEGDKAMLDGLRRFTNSLRDFRFIWAKIANRFYQIEKAQFAAQGKVSRWAALSPAYAKWKATHFPGRPILQREGALMTSLTRRGSADSIYVSEPLSLTVGTNVKYAGFHQGGKRKMPARPVIELSEEDARGFAAIFEEGIATIGEKAGFQVTRLAA